MNLTIYIPDALGERIKAASLSSSVSRICRDALERALEEAAPQRSTKKAKKGGRRAAR
jgi:hypothetical protein